MFGENLKTLRKQKGFSQEELATRLHVVRQTISKWEPANKKSSSKKRKSRRVKMGTSNLAVFIQTVSYPHYG